jgi:hypothetical protein
VESNKLDFLFYDFSVIFKDLAEINKKKDKTAFKTAYNRAGGNMNGFKS